MLFSKIWKKRDVNKVRSQETPVLISSKDSNNNQQQKSFFGFWGAAVSDVGCVRSNNEDNYILGNHTNMNAADRSTVSVSYPEKSSAWRVAGVFDGMGGGEAGEVASGSTAAIFLETVSNSGEGLSKKQIDWKIKEAFLRANNHIVSLQDQYKIFGTTGTVLCADAEAFKIYHLGDSRAYLLRENELQQLTTDQTLAQMKIEAGLYREDDPAAQKDRYKLTEYIGRDWTKKNIKPVESHWIPIASGDYILLCSDGMYENCKKEEMQVILTGPGDLAHKCDALVEMARTKGGDDNITCVLICFNEIG